MDFCTDRHPAWTRPWRRSKTSRAKAYRRTDYHITSANPMVSKRSSSNASVKTRTPNPPKHFQGIWYARFHTVGRFPVPIPVFGKIRPSNLESELDLTVPPHKSWLPTSHRTSNRLDTSGNPRLYKWTSVFACQFYLSANAFSLVTTWKAVIVSIRIVRFSLPATSSASVEPMASLKFSSKTAELRIESHTLVNLQPD